ncbi:MAG: hypothetical protein HXX08_12955 [Chloroflexi bacterium]|uniref:Uncharacterized protein n=1 Tax=Candidatus Chlorohelix allophototropha TaxID=3003348 RepID=A0A8T7M3X7_9CHLR|nr:hypothetical protein [Chloroflexota bacterium]
MGAAEFYEIKLVGNLDPNWSEWFDKMYLTNEENNITVLRGQVKDQAALHSIFVKIHDLNLTILSVIRLEQNKAEE